MQFDCWHFNSPSNLKTQNDSSLIEKNSYNNKPRQQIILLSHEAPYEYKPKCVCYAQKI